MSSAPPNLYKNAILPKIHKGGMIWLDFFLQGSANRTATNKVLERSFKILLSIMGLVRADILMPISFVEALVG